jgi:hypothetical protein
MSILLPRWLRRLADAIVAVIAALALFWAASFWWRRSSLPWDSQLAAAIAVPAVALVCAVWFLWWRLPKRQMRWVTASDSKERADIEDNFRKTIGQAIAAAVALIGAGAGLFQFLQQQKATTHQSLKQLAVTREQIAAQQNATEASRKSAEDLRISNQIAKGFEQLSGVNIEMRLGGIYGLEGVMNNSPEYHQAVLEALCAFVREGTIGKIVNERPTTDIQAALTVIGRRNARPGSAQFG